MPPLLASGRSYSASRTLAPIGRYAAGDTIADKYELGRKLGAGGMGSLWMARNVLLDAPVALKLIRSDIASEELEERFLTEARLLARLHHPNIVRVFDFGRTRHDDPFIVMELLQGETLGGLLDRNARVAAGRTIQLILPIVDALVVAHQKGIVHRDIKPENVFLADNDGRFHPKLIDFGIAKSTTLLDQKKLTRSGTIVGSAEYLSPEQARGSETVDSRTDIWSLCVVIYECLTGQLPFDGKNYNSLLRKIIEEEPIPLCDLGAGDPLLWNILKTGLAKEPGLRYQSARELGVALADWLLSHGIQEDACGQSLRATWKVNTGSSPEIHEVAPVVSSRPSAATLPNGAAAPAPRSKSSRYARIALSVAALTIISVILWLRFNVERVQPVASVPLPPEPPVAAVTSLPKPTRPQEIEKRAPPLAPAIAKAEEKPIPTRQAAAPARPPPAPAPIRPKSEPPDAKAIDFGF